MKPCVIEQDTLFFALKDMDAPRPVSYGRRSAVCRSAFVRKRTAV